ncbi:MAG: hypothetical protein FWC85_02165, partial [Elusimicrobia bacterium]|nr:hypothetical protein [Elusimicrobiota bacterium]
QNLFKKYPDVSIIGGPNLTPLESSNEFERLQGIALESEFVSGEMTYRYKSAGDNSVTSDSRLILCNMAFRREVFTSSGLTFETKLFYAEENLLITQAINLGLTALYCPDLIVYHSRRQDFLGLIQQFFNSGYGRGLLPAFSKGTLQWYHLAPAALVVYICISFYIVNLFLFLPPILYYTLNSYPISKKNGGRISGTFKIAFIAFTIHFAYGTGIIFATIKRLIWKIQKKFS